MRAILLVIALASLVAIGLGVALLRTHKNPAEAATGTWAQLLAWAATLTGRRAIASGVVAAGAILFMAVLLLRP